MAVGFLCFNNGKRGLMVALTVLLSLALLLVVSGIVLGSVSVNAVENSTAKIGEQTSHLAQDTGIAGMITSLSGMFLGLGTVIYGIDEGNHPTYESKDVDCPNGGRGKCKRSCQKCHGRQKVNVLTEDADGKYIKGRKPRWTTHMQFGIGLLFIAIFVLGGALGLGLSVAGFIAGGTIMTASGFLQRHAHEWTSQFPEIQNGDKAFRFLEQQMNEGGDYNSLSDGVFDHVDIAEIRQGTFGTGLATVEQSLQVDTGFLGSTYHILGTDQPGFVDAIQEAIKTKANVMEAASVFLEKFAPGRRRRRLVTLEGIMESIRRLERT